MSSSIRYVLPCFHLVRGILGSDGMTHDDDSIIYESNIGELGVISQLKFTLLVKFINLKFLPPNCYMCRGLSCNDRHLFTRYLKSK